MSLVLLLGFLVLFVGLVGAGWLLGEVLRQQGRLLLRLEAVEARAARAGLPPWPAGPAPAGREVAPVPGFVPPVVALAQHTGNGVHARPRPSASAIGEPAPDFSLPDLSGNLVKLSAFRGSTTLVLFWRPSCAFCQRLLPDLLAWEERPTEGAPALVVVSSESVADNRAMGLHSLVVLDHAAMSVGSQFGASGTPMAVLLDEEGKVASALAAGGPSVLALARGVQETVH